MKQHEVPNVNRTPAVHRRLGLTETHDCKHFNKCMVGIQYLCLNPLTDVPGSNQAYGRFTKKAQGM